MTDEAEKLPFCVVCRRHMPEEGPERIKPIMFTATDIFGRILSCILVCSDRCAIDWVQKDVFANASRR